MQPDNWSKKRNRIVSCGLVALLLGSALAAPAAADPQMYFAGADVEQESALVGENVTVIAEVENIGSSGGGYTLDFERNGTQFSSKRVVIDAGEDRLVNESVQFDSPGTYEITVNGERAGLVEVRRAVATVDRQTNESRTLNVRGQSVAIDSQHSVSLPSAENRSFALEQWSVRMSGASYEGTLTEYSDPAESGEDLPPAENSTLVGLLTVDTSEDVEAATMQFAVSDDRLRAAGLDRDAVTVFQRNGSSWEPVETSIVEEGNARTVYEASATTGSAYAVGRIDAGVSVVDSSIRTEPVQAGQKLVLDAELRNDGSVDTEYEGTLYVNAEPVNTTTVTVPAAGERTLSLSYVATESGTYTLALDDSERSTVVITDSQATGGSPTEGPDQSGSGSDDAIVRGPIPGSIFGVNTLFVGVGAVLVLVVAVLFLRRGGNNGGSNFDDL